MFLASFLGGQLIGGIPLLLIMLFKMAESGFTIMPNQDNMADLSVYGIDQNFGLALMILPFIASLIILLFLFKALHRRNYMSLFNGFEKIRWRRFFLAAGIWAALSAIYLIFDYQSDSQNYTQNFNLSQFIILCIISLCLIPFQASYEELMFRGYLAQGVGVWTKNRLMVIIVPSILFGLMHTLNPEVETYGFWIVMPQYIFFGLLFGLLTVLDNGIEVAMGAHSANNIFMSIFITSKSSVLQTPAMFVQENVNAEKDLIVLIIMGTLFTILLSKSYSWDFKVLFRKIDVPVNEINQLD